MIGQKGIPALSGGIERHVEELSVRLAKAGHEVFVYTRPYYTSPTLKKYMGVNLISLSSIKTKCLDAITHTFLASLHALFQNYDIIHYHGVGPATLSFIPRLFSRAKVVVTFHCQDKYHQKWGRVARAYLTFGELASCKFPHRTIAVSKTIQKFCRDRFKKEVDYIPNGVNANSEFQIQNSKILDRFGLEKNGYILTVARLIKHKGIHHLIQAYKNLKTDKKLVIVGDSVFTDNYVKYLKDLAKDNKDIIFCGEQRGKNLAQLFRNAYLYIHPSEREGLSITILEALSFGRCVLASDIPENKEVILNYGFIFKNKNIKDLKDKLEFLLTNPELVSSTGEKAQAYLKENYNWEDIVKKTIKLYQSLIKFSKHILSKKERQSLTSINQAIADVFRE